MDKLCDSLGARVQVILGNNQKQVSLSTKETINCVIWQMSLCICSVFRKTELPICAGLRQTASFCLSWNHGNSLCLAFRRLRASSSIDDFTSTVLVTEGRNHGILPAISSSRPDELTLFSIILSDSSAYLTSSYFFILLLTLSFFNIIFLPSFNVLSRRKRLVRIHTFWGRAPCLLILDWGETAVMSLWKSHGLQPPYTWRTLTCHLIRDSRS